MNLDRLVTEQPDAASARKSKTPAPSCGKRLRTFLACAGDPGRPDGRRAAFHGPEVGASELRLDARLPHLDDHERDQIQRSMRRIVDKLLHARPYGCRSCRRSPTPSTMPPPYASSSRSTRRPSPR